MERIVDEIWRESRALKDRFFSENRKAIVAAADRVAECLVSGHKILLFGNGGSAADAQHLAAEFVNRFRIERPPLAAVALTTDTSVLTSIGNDYDFAEIFEKQVRAIGARYDIAMGLSTSGGSKNVVRGVQAAREIGMTAIGFCGRGGALAELSDMAFCIPSDVTARVQEVHIMLGHMLCELVDRILFPEQFGRGG
ncbi:MAG: D-sedoheptulose 7-phosphate isomerase [Desulfobacterales bacterium]|jgi:D-sedoheptulose 7-phosphate isomerase